MNQVVYSLEASGGIACGYTASYFSLFGLTCGPSSAKLKPYCPKTKADFAFLLASCFDINGAFSFAKRESERRPGRLDWTGLDSTR